METNTKLPRFNGKTLVEIPSIFRPPMVSQIGFLEGDFGEAFLKEYQGRVKTDYNGNSVLDVLKYEDGVVKGSNPFAVVLANQILRQEGLRTATQADLEKVLRTGALNFKGTYQNTSLVLRTEEDNDYDKNTPLAKNLAKQLKARGIKFGPENPVMIPLTGLEIETAERVHGLGFGGFCLTFRLREDAEVYEAPILANKDYCVILHGEDAEDELHVNRPRPMLKIGGGFDSKDIDEKTGLPKKLDFDLKDIYEIRGHPKKLDT